MIELYTLDGSRHSREAKQLLEEAGIDFVERDILDAPFWITSAPTFVEGWSKYVGLEEISEYVERRE